MSLQTSQEVTTVTKTECLIDLLFMQEVSTNPSSTHLRRNVLRCTADARWQMVWRHAQLPPWLRVTQLSPQPGRKWMIYLYRKNSGVFKCYWKTFFLTPPTLPSFLGKSQSKSHTKLKFNNPNLDFLKPIPSLQYLWALSWSVFASKCASVVP